MHLIYASHQFLAPPNPRGLGMSFSWQVDYSDVLDRVVALPVALTWEEGAQKSRCHPDQSFTRVETRHPTTGRGFTAQNCQIAILAPPNPSI